MKTNNSSIRKDDSRIVSTSPKDAQPCVSTARSTTTILRGILLGTSIAIGFLGSALLAVAVTGNVKTWTTGETLSATDLNTTFASLKTAIEGIPNWTKAANGTDAVYTAGNVGIGTASPGAGLDIAKSNLTMVLGATDSELRTDATIKISRVGSYPYTNSAKPNTIFMTYNTPTVSELNLGGGSGALNAATDILFHTASNTGTLAGTERMRIASNGYVGIGTTNPTQTLHLHNGSQPVLQLTSASGLFQIGVNDANSWISSANTNPLEFFTNSSERMRITSTGNVGIGTTTPSANLHVVGTTLAAVWSTSDERYKKNIQPVSNAMDKILKLRGVHYDWRQEDFKDMKFKSGRDIGFIGQEVEKVLPEVVNKDSKGYLSVNYSNILPILVEAFKEYKSGNDTRVSELKTKQDEGSKSLSSLKADNEKLSLRLADIERSRNAVTDENAELKKRLDRLESTIANMESRTTERMVKK